MTTKQLNIRNKSYYFHNDLINLIFIIYYIDYVYKNKPEDWCVNSVNPLYLIINKVFCFVGEENGVEYLKIDKGNKKIEDSILSLWNEVFTGVKHYIKKISHECKTFSKCKGSPHCEEFGKIKFSYGEDYDRIKFISNDSLPVGKLIYFPTITVVIRCVFRLGDLFYPQVYLDDALYQL